MDENTYPKIYPGTDFVVAPPMPQHSAAEPAPQVLTPAENIMALKQQYGKLYRLDVDVDPDDGLTGSYIFHLPNVAEINRYVSCMGKNPYNAAKTLMMDCVVPHQRAALDAYIAMYPAAILGMSDKLLPVMGIGQNANLTRL